MQKELLHLPKLWNILEGPSPLKLYFNSEGIIIIIMSIMHCNHVASFFPCYSQELFSP